MSKKNMKIIGGNLVIVALAGILIYHAFYIVAKPGAGIGLNEFLRKSAFVYGIRILSIVWTVCGLAVVNLPYVTNEDSEELKSSNNEPSREKEI